MSGDQIVYIINEFFFFLTMLRVACGILVPWSEIKPGLPAVEAQSPNNQWTTREVPGVFFPPNST